MEVDRPAPEQPRQLQRHARQRDQARLAAGLELHQQIQIALGTGSAPLLRAEQRKAADAMLCAESRQRCSFDWKHHPVNLNL
jgi:hypothetical protein